MTTLDRAKREINNNMAGLVNRNITPSTKRANDEYIKAIKANNTITKRYTGRLTDGERKSLYKHVLNIQNSVGMLLGLWDINGDEIPLKRSHRIPLKAILAASLALAVLIPTYVLLTPVRAQESAHEGTQNTIGNLSNTYAKVMVVDAVQYNPEDDSDVTFVDCMGFRYHYQMDGGDIKVGDIYSCIMDTNGTQKVLDDIVTDIKYERIDLLIKWYNDRCNMRETFLNQL